MLWSHATKQNHWNYSSYCTNISGLNQSNYWSKHFLLLISCVIKWGTDLFHLSILFFPYISHDNTGRFDPSLCSLKRLCTITKMSNFERKYSPRYHHKICIWKAKSTSENVYSADSNLEIITETRVGRVSPNFQEKGTFGNRERTFFLRVTEKTSRP